MRYGHLGIYFCRDQDMKVFFRGWGTQRGFFMMWGWMGVWDCCIKFFPPPPADVKSVSKKCCLQPYCLGSLLALLGPV
jgi:hypothetical protein